MNKHSIIYASIVLLLPCASHAVLPELVNKVAPSAILAGKNLVRRTMATVSTEEKQGLYEKRIKELQKQSETDARLIKFYLTVASLLQDPRDDKDLVVMAEIMKEVNLSHQDNLNRELFHLQLLVPKTTSA